MGGTKCLRLGTCELEDMGGVLPKELEYHAELRVVAMFTLDWTQVSQDVKSQKVRHARPSRHEPHEREDSDVGNLPPKRTPPKS